MVGKMRNLFSLLYAVGRNYWHERNTEVTTLEKLGGSELPPAFEPEATYHNRLKIQAIRNFKSDTSLEGRVLH